MALMLDANFFIAVIAATIVSLVIGGIWYAGPVFGKAWMAALGKTEADKEAMRKQAPKGFAVGLVGSFIASSCSGLSSSTLGWRTSGCRPGSAAVWSLDSSSGSGSR